MDTSLFAEARDEYLKHKSKEQQLLKLKEPRLRQQLHVRQIPSTARSFSRRLPSCVARQRLRL